MNVPALRFPEFEGELMNTKLGELMAISSASRVHKDEWTEEGVPFFRSSDVVANYKGMENKKAFISRDLFDKLSQKSGHLAKDDLLVTGGGSIGVPYLVTSNDPLYSKDADLIWLKNDKKTSGQYIFAFLTSQVFRKYLKSISHIGTISHYTIEQAKATPILLPSLPEQKKIAAFLGVVDAKIAALRALRDGLERYKRGLMQALFCQSLRFTKSDGSAFPDWEDAEFDDVFSSIPTKAFQVLSSEIRAKGQYPVVDQGKSLVAGYSDATEKVLQNKGAIVFGDHTTELKFVVSDFIVGADGTKVLRSKAGNLRFLYFFLKQNNVEQEGYKRHFSILRQLVLALPHPDEQAKIAEALSAMDAKIAAMGDQVARMETFKKGLLQQMFI